MKEWKSAFTIVDLEAFVSLMHVFNLFGAIRAWSTFGGIWVEVKRTSIFYNCLSCLCDYFLMLSFFFMGLDITAGWVLHLRKVSFFRLPHPLPLSTKFLIKFYIIYSNACVCMPLCKIVFRIQLIFKIYMFASFNIPMPVYFCSLISLFFWVWSAFNS